MKAPAIDEWRARLGFLVPSANAVVERDARLALPDDVTAHFGRMKLTEDTPEQIAGLVDFVPQAARDVADAGVSVIGFACTTGSLFKGLGYDHEISDRIREETGIPATTTSSAVVDALRLLGIHRPIVVSPYEDWLNAKVVHFLTESGFEVSGVFGFGRPEQRALEAITPEQIVGAARSLDSWEADGCLLSCTGFRGFEAVKALEDAIGKPVINSNQATFWQMLRMARIDDSISGFGRLLEMPRVMASAPPQ
jgi:maleate isomerase